MTIQDVLDAMGSAASEMEANAMAEILQERNIEINGISDEEFFALIPEAIERARRNREVR